MEKIKEHIASGNVKKLSYVLCAIALVCWTAFRFAAIGSESSRNVFNPTRVALDKGAPIEVIDVATTTGILRDPIFVKNNRALVSYARAKNLSAGQKIGNGVITYVSKSVDLDSGMYLIKTRNTSDGLQYAELKTTGCFVPVSAVNDGFVFVVDGDLASLRKVVISNQDSENVLIKSGIADGDKVILSRVIDGQKIQVK